MISWSTLEFKLHMISILTKCIKCWNAAIGVDEAKNTTSANQRLSSTNDKKNIEIWLIALKT